MMMLRSCLSKIVLTSALVVALTVLIMPLKPREAGAFGCCPQIPECSIAENTITREWETILHEWLREFITDEFVKQQNWFIYNFFQEYVLPGLMGMAQQLSTAGETQVFAVGAILDAKEQLENERWFQVKTAEAHKDYRPTNGICTIGTAAKSMSSSERRGELAANVLSKRMIDREMGLRYSVGSEGMASDMKSRTEQLQRRFCDRHSNAGNTGNLCLAGSGGANVNKDIDYAGTVGLRRTLSLDLTNTAEDVDDENVMALATNLYGNRVFERTPMPSSSLEGDNGQVAGQQAWYLDQRAITAKRSVAQNSFNAITGMKASGSAAAGDAANYLYAIFSQLGVADDAQAREMLGTNPSYYALLEAIAQKIYQDPEFFTNLYDTDANVQRKDVAMQAINLMLDRDTFKSELRTESLLSVLLETEMIRYQKDLANRLNQMDNQAAPGK